MSSKTSSLDTLSPEMEHLYEKLHCVAEHGCGLATGEWPLINIYRMADGALVEALIPDIELSQLNLTVKDRVLKIDRKALPCAVRKEDRLFLRTIEFPFSIDVAHSHIHTANGVLRIKLGRSTNQECFVNEHSDGVERQSEAIEQTLTGIGNSSPELIPIVPISVDNRQPKLSDCMFIPKTEIFETEGSYLMVVELPGIPWHAIDITLNDSALTIEAKKTLSLLQELHLVYSEFEIVGYRRRFSLFKDIDEKAITALLKNGTLKMRLPKKAGSKMSISKDATTSDG